MSGLCTVDRSAYSFMREHAGWVFGESARCALSLARSEALLLRAVDLGVASVEWCDDDVPYDSCEDPAFVAAQFESNAWTGPYGCVVKIGTTGATGSRRSGVEEPENWSSLWGIVVGPRGVGDPYCRVVAAELASELEDELRQAIGDALDACEGVEA